MHKPQVLTHSLDAYTFSKFNAYKMITHTCMHTQHTHTHAHTHTHTESYIRAMGLKKRFLRRKVFNEDVKELTEVE